MSLKQRSESLRVAEAEAQGPGEGYKCVFVEWDDLTVPGICSKKGDTEEGSSHLRTETEAASLGSPLLSIEEQERLLTETQQRLSSEEWTEQFEGLNSLQSLSKFLPTLVASKASALTAPLGVLVQSLRSSVSRNGIVTAGYLARGLTEELERLEEQGDGGGRETEKTQREGQKERETLRHGLAVAGRNLLPVLLAKSAVEKGFIVQSALASARRFAETGAVSASTLETLCQVLQTGTKQRNFVIAGNAVAMMQRAVANLAPKTLPDAVILSLLPPLAHGLDSPRPQAKRAAREVLLLLDRRFRQTATQPNLAQPASSVPSMPSISLSGSAQTQGGPPQTPQQSVAGGQSSMPPTSASTVRTPPPHRASSSSRRSFLPRPSTSSSPQGPTKEAEREREKERRESKRGGLRESEREKERESSKGPNSKVEGGKREILAWKGSGKKEEKETEREEKNEKEGEVEEGEEKKQTPPTVSTLSVSLSRIPTQSSSVRPLGTVSAASRTASSEGPEETELEEQRSTKSTGEVPQRVGAQGEGLQGMFSSCAAAAQSQPQPQSASKIKSGGKKVGMPGQKGGGGSSLTEEPPTVPVSAPSPSPPRVISRLSRVSLSASTTLPTDGAERKGKETELDGSREKEKTRVRERESGLIRFAKTADAEEGAREGPFWASLDTRQKRNLEGALVAAVSSSCPPGASTTSLGSKEGGALRRLERGISGVAGEREKEDKEKEKDSASGGKGGGPSPASASTVAATVASPQPGPSGKSQGGVGRGGPRGRSDLRQFLAQSRNQMKSLQQGGGGGLKGGGTAAVMVGAEKERERPSRLVFCPPTREHPPESACVNVPAVSALQGKGPESEERVCGRDSAGCAIETVGEKASPITPFGGLPSTYASPSPLPCMSETASLYSSCAGTVTGVHGGSVVGVEGKEGDRSRGGGVEGKENAPPGPARASGPFPLS
uniref:CLASP N-terminal domain-containing protein n=1 Tax=Chromera velia CCMP2878 TaxID=1169474 RepID=A0A0G4FRD6_9ALVE|eukprot:Cvel_3653.t1-p1 / transcript=Cvel_3653.t1 / gene=Cvel_3653 / organism=Chromera_velia_CCMP2878 / gene_product=hypothetical protein / transcript_product=hypothetical protein / location=Cvel_scaffold151:44543-48571(-) / protein_length=952 / sequence_SO=supercontig / SO=protein_coding / is_pseudo=false